MDLYFIILAQFFFFLIYKVLRLWVSLVKPLKLYFLKKWDFQKVWYEKMFFEKTECLIKTVKKCFLKKLSVWLELIKVAV